MTKTIGDPTSLNQLVSYILNMNMLTKIAQSTPPNTKVQNSKIWHTLLDPTLPQHTNHNIPTFPTYTFALLPKYPLEYSYYIDGSFIPLNKSHLAHGSQK
jgi:hypothetical protein